MNKDSVIFTLIDRRPPRGEEIDWPESITDSVCLSVAQQVERFGIGCGNLPTSDLYDSEEAIASGEQVVSPYGLSDPVDVALMKDVVDNKVQSIKESKANKETPVSSVGSEESIKTKAVENGAVAEGSGE